MDYVTDRRPRGSDKHVVNRRRFLERYKEQIRKAVKKKVDKDNITDIGSDASKKIPIEGVNDITHEPEFIHGKGGITETVHPGNRKFTPGDRIDRPKGGDGSGGDGSDSGEGMDDFLFELTTDEFLDFMFEGLEIPNLTKKMLSLLDEFERRNAGFTSVGSPSRMHLVRTYTKSLSRRRVFSSAKRQRISALYKELEVLVMMVSVLGVCGEDVSDEDTRISEILEEIVVLERGITKIPLFEERDIVFRAMIKTPLPTTCAVMFCIMDVSGSMDQATKEIAKRFFILLYLFLRTHYEKIELVFIRHHTRAKEVDEEEFFYSRETGGTIVSSALTLMKEIMDERYSSTGWNIYVAQASDGDNWDENSSKCGEIMTKDIMPYVQYYTYVEITPRDHQDLWRAYCEIEKLFPDSFAMRQIQDLKDIYPVFRELFEARPKEVSYVS